MRTQDVALLRVEDLHVSFGSGRRRLEAVSGVSLEIMAGETLGLVGESGCGKTTLARAIMQIEPASAGAVLLAGQELTGLSSSKLRPTRRSMQMVFQDPVSSLNPRRKVLDLVCEPLDIWEQVSEVERQERARQVLGSVGLDLEQVGGLRPRQLSGGQCQRVSLARALTMRPRLIICDEIVSALDVSVQAQVLNLLEDLKARYDLTMLFIAHDLAVVRSISDRVAVMYLGKLCEVADADELYAAPAHPYTQALLSASAAHVLGPLPERIVLRGEPPSPTSPPSGCRFWTRCPSAQARCAEEVPVSMEISPRHHVACHYPVTS